MQLKAFNNLRLLWFCAHLLVINPGKLGSYNACVKHFSCDFRASLSLIPEARKVFQAADVSNRHSTRRHLTSRESTGRTASTWLCARGSPRATTGPDAEPKGDQRKPHVDHLAPEHPPAAFREETSDRNRRDLNGTPQEEVPSVVEWGEECHSQASIGHGVEDRMGGGEHEKKRCESPEPWGFAEFQSCDNQCPDQGKAERVKETAVTKQVVVRYAQCERNYIRIRQNGRPGSQHPESPTARAIRRNLSEDDRGKSMSKSRGHDLSRESYAMPLL